MSWPAADAVPRRLATPDLVLEPLGPEHNTSDHEAWSSSIAHIRSTPGFSPELWKGDDWPVPMTPEENLADLVQHRQEFDDGVAFAFTVLHPNTGAVIGCVYIDPDTEAEAMVRSWVRADMAERDDELFRAVSAWLRTHWPFGSVRWPGRDYSSLP
ncbi:MAG: N-acetyltransferase [Acidimicrobiia bacterium]|nr:N-acetyltransferase [Acidimicrobiia bacterium]MDH4307025.1 N-acetyltransferase [Acidimicrobiia bacterium]